MALPKIRPINEEKEKKPLEQTLPSLEDIEESIVPIDELEEDYDFEDVVTEVDKEFTQKMLDEYENHVDDQKHKDPMVYDEIIDSDKYIDKKEKKIIPTGGKKSKRSIKAGDFDSRKNLLAKTRVIQTITMLVLVVLFVLGLKNTFFPSNNYSRAEIERLAQRAVGNYGFPSERGQAFVEDFIEVYLSIDPANPARTNELNFFYTGDYKPSTSSNYRMTTSKSTEQVILISPKVYEVTPLSDYSTMYKVKAFVSDTTGTKSEGTVSAGRWLSFAVNVYYNEDQDSLAITQDSPSIVPNYNVDKVQNVPTPELLGNGTVNTEILSTLTPTIDGYVNAYATSSISSHNEIVQYIPENATVDLYSGFGGAVEVKSKDNRNIKKVVYNTTNANEYKVDVEVTWVDKAATGDDNEVSYTSKYVMTIIRTSDSKYLVTGFKPFLYYMK